MSRLSHLALAVLAAAVSALCLALPAAAYPDARVDEAIKPDFGVLLHPRVHRYGDCAYRRYCHGRDYGYGGYGGYRVYDRYWDHGRFRDGFIPQRSLVVDCGHPAGPTPIADALAQLVDGGTLFIKAQGAACTETIVVTRPVTIIGDGVPAFAVGPNPMPATLAPAPDAPCIVVDHVRAVEIRDLVLEAREGRDHACVEAYDSDVALTRTVVRYQGNASALYMDGGRVVVRDSDIDGRTFDPAVAADGVEASFYNTTVRGDAVGVDITLGGATLSHFVDVGVIAHRDEDRTARPETGIVIHGAREASQKVEIEDSTIRGWRTGIMAGRGATVSITGSRIGRAGVGVASDGDLDAHQLLIGASDVGIYAYGGHARLEGIVVHGAGRAPVVADREAQVSDSDEWVFAPTCGGYGGASRWTCRRLDQLPSGYDDDAAGDDGPWGWRDQAYRSVPPPEPPRRRRCAFCGD